MYTWTTVIIKNGKRPILSTRTRQKREWAWKRVYIEPAWLITYQWCAASIAPEIIHSYFHQIVQSLTLSLSLAILLSLSLLAYPFMLPFCFALSLSLSQSFSLFPTEHLAILYAFRCLSNAYTRSSFIQSFSSHTAYSLWRIPWPTTNSIVSMSLFFLFRNTISDAMEYTEENSSSQTSKMFTINRNHSFCYNSFSDKKPGKISHRFA